MEVGGLKWRPWKALVRISSQGTEEIGDIGAEKATGERNRVGRDRVQTSLQALEDPA